MYALCKNILKRNPRNVMQNALTKNNYLFLCRIEEQYNKLKKKNLYENNIFSVEKINLFRFLFEFLGDCREKF